MSDARRIAAVVPVASMEGAKTRLGGWLDAEERADLVEELLVRTLSAIAAVHRIDDVVVVSPDRAILERASTAGVRTLRQRSDGLNAAIVEARDDVVAGDADALIVVPIDLPFVSADALERLVAEIDLQDRLVLVVPDRHGTGTNVLALRPPTIVEPLFGSDSRAAHAEAARDAGAHHREVDGPLSIDLDTPEDLILIESMAEPGGPRAD